MAYLLIFACPKALKEPRIQADLRLQNLFIQKILYDLTKRCARTYALSYYLVSDF